MEVHPLSSKRESCCQLSVDHMITMSIATERHRGELYQDAKPIVPWRKKKLLKIAVHQSCGSKKSGWTHQKLILAPNKKPSWLLGKPTIGAWEMRIFTLRKTSQNPQLGGHGTPRSTNRLAYLNACAHGTPWWFGGQSCTIHSIICIYIYIIYNI